MNHIFRIVWNRALSVWQVASELAAPKGGAKAVKAVALALSTSLPLLHQVAVADALPTGGEIAGGVAAISVTGATMLIHQQSERLALDWQSFSVGKGHVVRFEQPSATASALNRVLGSDVSLIQGRLSANGRLFLVNPNGVLFTPTAQVDVGSLVASSLNITPDDFMTGRYAFEGESGAAVENQGQIHAAEGGSVALIAARVVNLGDIEAPGGQVLLGAGRKVLLDFGGAANIEIQEGALDALIAQGGAIRAAGGRVWLSARSARELVGSVINHSGLTEVNSLSALGGSVAMEADAITLGGTSVVDASGAAGGGQVLVGGEWQGQGAMRQAQTVTMESGARISADATQLGAGGEVVLWSDVGDASSLTRVHGSVSAKAGPLAGDGGRIETSGHHLDTSGANVSAAATRGHAGKWLLDPTGDTTINGASGDGATLVASLNAGTDVEYAVTGGDLTVSGDLAKTAGDGTVTLTLKAEGDITLNAGVALESTAGPMNVVLWSNSDDGATVGDGYILMRAGAVISTAGGHVWMGGGAQSLTNWNGLTVGNGYALAGADINSFAFNGHSAPIGSGIYLEQATIGTGGGSFAAFGKGDQASLHGRGILTIGDFDLNVGGGKIEINAISREEIALIFGHESGYTSSEVATLRSANTDTDAVRINAQSLNAAAWSYGLWVEGTATVQTTQGGGIDVTALGNAKGINLGYSPLNAPGKLRLLANSGDILMNTGAKGLNIQTTGSIELGATAGSDVTSATGHITVISDDFTGGAAGAVTFNTTGTVTVKPRENYSFASTFDSSSIIYTGGVSGLTIGHEGNTQAVTLGSATAIAGPVTVYGGDVSIDDDVDTRVGGAGGDVVIKASGNITLAQGKKLQTTGGDVLLWSNTDNEAVNDDGYILLRDGSSITTAGGHLWMGGGAPSNTLWNGLTVGAGYALAGAPISSSDFLNIQTAGPIPSGIYLENTSIDTAGGDVALRGMGDHAGERGILTIGDFNLDAGAGTIDLAAQSLNELALIFGHHSGYSSSEVATIRSTNPAADAVRINAQSLNAAAWSYGLWVEGTATVQNTNGGGIDVTALGTTKGINLGYSPLNAPGNLRLLANSGDILLNTGAKGLNIQTTGSIDLGAKAGSDVTSAAGHITVISDDFTGGVAGAMTFNTTGTVTVKPRETYSFTSAFDTSSITYTGGVSGLTIGHADNTGGVTVGSSTSIAGPITIFGGAITVDAKLESTGSHAVTLHGSGLVSDGNGGYIVADQLALKGSGSFALDSAANAVNTIAAGNDDSSPVGAFTFVNSGALVIGAVNPVGITSSAAISVATVSGDLTVAQDVITTDTTTSAIVLNAGRSESPGSATGGDLVLLNHPTIGAGVGGQVKLYTGAKANPALHNWAITRGATKIGLADESWSITDTSPDLAIFREGLGTPVYLRLVADVGSVYGSSPNLSYALYTARTGGTEISDASPTGAVTWNGTVPTASSDVGDYSLSYASGITLGVDSYDLNAGDSVVWTVSPRPVTLTALGARRVYGEANPVAFGFSILDHSGGTTLPNGDAIASVTHTLAATATPTASAGSSHAISPSAAVFSSGSSSNYQITYTDGALSIDPRAITLVANAVSKTYGEADPALSVSVSNTAADEGVATGDSLAQITGTLSRQAGEDVGTYDIALGAGASAGSKASNYHITFDADNKALSIHRRGITLALTPAASGKTYGEADPTLAVTASSGSLATGDSFADLTGALTRASGEDVGDYLVSLGQGLKAGNYDISFAPQDSTLSIAPRAITLVANAVSKTYGEADPALSVSVSNTAADEGVATGDSLAQITGTLSRQAGEDVGAYDIALGAGASAGSKASNYHITFDADNKALSIHRRGITLALTPAASGKTYGEADPTLAVTASSGSLATGDSFADLTGALTRASGEDVGDYLVSLGQGLKAGNYDISFAPQDSTLSIAPRAITLVANAVSKTYGEADPALSVSVSNTAADEGVATGDSLDQVTGTLSRQAGEDVGAYDIALGAGASAGSKASNYQINFEPDNNALMVVPSATATAPEPAGKLVGLPALAWGVSRTVVAEALPSAVSVGGLLMIPVSPAQIGESAGGDITQWRGGEAHKLVELAQAMGYTGLLVIDGGVALPVQLANGNRD